MTVFWCPEVHSWLGQKRSFSHYQDMKMKEKSCRWTSIHSNIHIFLSLKKGSFSLNDDDCCPWFRSLKVAGQALLLLCHYILHFRRFSLTSFGRKKVEINRFQTEILIFFLRMVAAFFFQQDFEALPPTPTTRLRDEQWGSISHKKGMEVSWS